MLFKVINSDMKEFICASVCGPYTPVRDQTVPSERKMTLTVSECDVVCKGTMSKKVSASASQIPPGAPFENTHTQSG